MGITTPKIYLFSDQKAEGVEHLPLFEITYTHPSLDLSAFEAIVFTSKKAVTALERMGLAWQDKECYAIGEGTASAILDAGGKPIYTCSLSYGDHFAEVLIPMLQGKRVFFPRAKEVISSLYETLHVAKIDIIQSVVYETHCKTYASEEKPKEGSVLIFTSPSTVRCFEKNFGEPQGYIVVAIGEKTAQRVPEGVPIHMPHKQSIEASISLAYELFKQSRSKNHL